MKQLHPEAVLSQLGWLSIVPRHHAFSFRGHEILIILIMSRAPTKGLQRSHHAGAGGLGVVTAQGASSCSSGPIGEQSSAANVKAAKATRRTSHNASRSLLRALEPCEQGRAQFMNPHGFGHQLDAIMIQRSISQLILEKHNLLNFRLIFEQNQSSIEFFNLY